MSLEWLSEQPMSQVGVSPQYLSSTHNLVWQHRSNTHIAEKIIKDKYNNATHLIYGIKVWLNNNVLEKSVCWKNKCSQCHNTATSSKGYYRLYDTTMCAIKSILVL